MSETMISHYSAQEGTDRYWKEIKEYLDSIGVKQEKVISVTAIQHKIIHEIERNRYA